MVIEWDNKHAEQGADRPDISSSVRAAAYVRMSTEHQKYSTDNQLEAINRYAERRGYEVVRVYTDEGKSGLRLAGRDALQRLLNDVEDAITDFKVVLVYDVSRWGRFQDPDEAAEIELRCKRRGIKIHYCAEQFDNDGSIGSSIIKTVKRAMAGEYSRELSVKVRAGQVRLVRLGFRQGGAPGYGLRRMLVDHEGTQKAVLSRGQHKSIATDRVILVPGPDEEVAVVQRIYRMFVNEGRTEQEIAEALNTDNITTDFVRPWTRGTVHQILINEKYVGNNVWGRTSFKLKHVHVRNPEQEWIRADNVFEAIVSADMFHRAGSIILERAVRLSDDELLEKLRQLFQQTGYLSGLIIDEAEGCPSSSSYTSRFGSLLRAYALVGFSPDRDYRYLEVNRYLRQLYPHLITGIIHRIQAVGASARLDQTNDLISINDEFTVSFVVVRCTQTASGTLRWKVRLDSVLRPDITIVARMEPQNDEVRDYYVLPLLDMHEAVLRLCEFNGLSFDAYRFETLDLFFERCARTPLAEVA